AAFTGETPLLVAIKQMHETPPLPREHDPSLPVRMELVILRCLEKDPERRYQSLVELRDELRAMPITPRVVPTAPEAQKTVLIERPSEILPPRQEPAPAIVPAPIRPRQMQMQMIWLIPIAGALAISGWLVMDHSQPKSQPEPGPPVVATPKQEPAAPATPP